MSPKIIKNDELVCGADSGSFSLRSIDDECEQILSAARREADVIRAEARELLTQAKRALADLNARIPAVEAEFRQRAFDEGKRQGISEGIPAGVEQGRLEETKRIKSQTENLRSNLQQILAQVEAKREALVAEAKKDILRFAVKIAEKIVKARVKVDNEVVVRSIAAAVGLIAQEHKLQVLINPSESEVVEEYVPHLKSDFPKIESVQVVPDMSIGRGCCIVRTKSGQVDATIQTQLEEIEKQLIND